METRYQKRTTTARTGKAGDNARLLLAAQFKQPRSSILGGMRHVPYPHFAPLRPPLFRLTCWREKCDGGQGRIRLRVKKGSDFPRGRIAIWRDYGWRPNSILELMARLMNMVRLSPEVDGLKVQWYRGPPGERKGAEQPDRGKPYDWIRVLPDASAPLDAL